MQRPERWLFGTSGAVVCSRLAASSIRMSRPWAKTVFLSTKSEPAEQDDAAV